MRQEQVLEYGKRAVAFNLWRGGCKRLQTHGKGAEGQLNMARKQSPSTRARKAGPGCVVVWAARGRLIRSFPPATLHGTLMCDHTAPFLLLKPVVRAPF